MKPKEELGFNFDLINLCNQYHNSVLGAFFLDSIFFDEKVFKDKN